MIHQGLRPSCSIKSSSAELIHDIAAFSKTPCVIEGLPHLRAVQATWYDTNCIDFLGSMYELSSSSQSQKEELDNQNNENYERFLSVLRAQPGPWSVGLPECMVYREDPAAILPSRGKTSDVGYDLSVIRKVRELTPSVSLYDTGITLSVENGWYAEVVPRSSLSKSGFMMANSMGIIDRSYTGSIMVALSKIDPDATIEFPFRCCQIIFRHQIHMDIVEVSQPFDDTVRGAGGFGSTDLKVHLS
ncbi:Deoxyuridine 5'-triphosphate nucleotidohydrolase [Tetrabaena socialis]|uniref:Deoxyuridine 5'-triphosphate nucleotidohydrolase n=1 Tax=Tetrabaena socialis TaxID=47790 RepID=A0A2J8AJ91_9CHLO|nr:Deoxyuridine 5'-triphosphate nucleotidohydrolase [Tetrabaena socialis]|eukprot:PNH12592.1 Deoxyuridine 5'-triphosphate nucleotidohydrolase [Tetrabaena socialis]